MAFPRKKTTVYLDPTLLRAAKVVAASTGRHDYEVLEDALRQYLATQDVNGAGNMLRSLLDHVAQRSTVTDDEALQLAHEELHTMRQERSLGE